MNKRCCVYLTNEHPGYMKMAINSMRMLRKHNADLPVRCVFIRDHCSQTMPRDNISESTLSGNSELFLEMCRNSNVEVWERPPLMFRGEEKFFHINRMYLNDMQEESLLYIDADTFIFGDVTTIFDDYSDVEFAACPANWAMGRKWKKEYLPSGHLTIPFSSGVMLWNKGAVRDWSSKLNYYCRSLREGKHAISNWLYQQHDDCLLREEFSVSLHVAYEGIKYRYLKREDCQLILYPSDKNDVGNSKIFHCYSPNWRAIYQKLRWNNHRIKPFVRRSGDICGPVGISVEASDHPFFNLDTNLSEFFPQDHDGFQIPRVP